MQFRKIYIIACLVTVFSTFSAKSSDRKSLIATMEKISEANRQISKELSEWNKEKETLRLELSLLVSSIKDKAGNQEKLKKDIIDLKKKKALLLDTLSRQEKLRQSIKSAISKDVEFLLASCKKVPNSLKFIIKNECDRLKTFQADENKDLSEILSAINALTSSIVKAQKEVHKTKAVVSIDGKMQEVDALYLGTYTGYFKTLDGKTTGRLLLSGSKWNAKAEPETTTEITKLFEQFDKKAAPELIKLPIGGDK